MKAVITAGGRIDGAFAQAAGTRVKALAPVRGVAMLHRVIDALRQIGVRRLAVVGGQEVRNACGAQVERVIEESSSGSQNLLRALRAWPEDGQPLIYATSDVPYVTAGAVDEFLQRVPAGALALPLAETRDFVTRFPGAPSFGITLDGERVINGGVFVLPAGSTETIASVAGRLFDARKSPWQMATLVGAPVLLRFLLRRLCIADVEGRASAVLKVPSLAVRRCAPELAFDVDTAEEYRYACYHG